MNDEISQPVYVQRHRADETGFTVGDGITIDKVRMRNLGELIISPLRANVGARVGPGFQTV